MNMPSSLGSLSRKAIAISTVFLASTACDREPQRQCPPSDCSDQEAVSKKLQEDLAKTRTELAQAVSEGKMKEAGLQASLGQCNGEVSAIKKQKHDEENAKASEQTRQKEVASHVLSAIQKAGVREENREMVSVILTKLLLSNQVPDADDDVLRQVFGDDIKLQMIPLKQKTTLKSATADFLKAMNELPLKERATVIGWIASCVPAVVEAAGEFKKYETLFRHRVFDACPDESSSDSSKHPDCASNSLVVEYHNLPRFEKMVMRTIWQISVRPETVKSLGSDATNAIHKNGYGI